MLKFFEIYGNSMSPSLRKGELVLVLKYPFSKFLIKKNKIAIFKSKNKIFIKRIKNIDKNNKKLRLKGDNPFSISEEEIGDISFRELIGIVIKIIK